MAIWTHFLAASEADRAFTIEELEAFVRDLLHEQMVKLPAAILTGEARNIASYEMNSHEYEKHINTYIVPNDPGAMGRYIEGPDLLSDLLRYFGDDEEAFFAVLKRLPLEEKDCCICFAGVHEQLDQMYWEGAAIYLLTHPFPIEFCEPIGTELVPLVERPLAHYFMLVSSCGGTFEQKTNPLEPVLRRHLGPDLLMRETFGTL